MTFLLAILILAADTDQSLYAKRLKEFEIVPRIEGANSYHSSPILITGREDKDTGNVTTPPATGQPPRSIRPVVLPPTPGFTNRPARLLKPSSPMSALPGGTNLSYRAGQERDQAEKDHAGWFVSEGRIVKLQPSK